MTFQLLQATTQPQESLASEVVPVGIGTDYAEWELWKSQHPNADEQLIQDELAELGINLDSDQ